MAHSSLRGHDIYPENGEWFYCDTRTSTVGEERPCGRCGSERTTEGHDGCLGTLPGVMNACCGHGEDAKAYVQFENGDHIKGEDAVGWIESTTNGREEP